MKKRKIAPSSQTLIEYLQEQNMLDEDLNVCIDFDTGFQYCRTQMQKAIAQKFDIAFSTAARIFRDAVNEYQIVLPKSHLTLTNQYAYMCGKMNPSFSAFLDKVGLVPEQLSNVELFNCNRKFKAYERGDFEPNTYGIYPIGGTGCIKENAVPTKTSQKLIGISKNKKNDISLFTK